jgi:hypothetical protein
MTIRGLFQLAAASFYLLGGAAWATPVTNTSVGLNLANNGEIVHGFYYLNSSGADPLSTSSSWQAYGGDLAFFALTGSDSFSNITGSTGIAPFGAPDTTTYGEVFQLPIEDSLASWT